MTRKQRLRKEDLIRDLNQIPKYDCHGIIKLDPLLKPGERYAQCQVCLKVYWFTYKGRGPLPSTCGDEWCVKMIKLFKKQPWRVPILFRCKWCKRIRRRKAGIWKWDAWYCRGKCRRECYVHNSLS